MLPRVSLGLLALALASLAPTLANAAGQLFSGPLLGYQTHREVAVWLETENAREVALTYTRADIPPDTAADSPAARPVTVTLPAPTPTPGGGQPIKFVLGPLEMGARYTYTLAIDGEPVSRPTR